MSEEKLSVSVEQLIIIKFHTAEVVQPSEIHQRLEKNLEKHVSSKLECLNGLKSSREERERVENTQHNPLPRTSITPSVLTCLYETCRILFQHFVMHRFETVHVKLALYGLVSLRILIM